MKTPLWGPKKKKKTRGILVIFYMKTESEQIVVPAMYMYMYVRVCTYIHVYQCEYIYTYVPVQLPSYARYLRICTCVYANTAIGQ